MVRDLEQLKHPGFLTRGDTSRPNRHMWQGQVSGRAPCRSEPTSCKSVDTAFEPREAFGLRAACCRFRTPATCQIPIKPAHYRHSCSPYADHACSPHCPLAYWLFAIENHLMGYPLNAPLINTGALARCKTLEAHSAVFNGFPASRQSESSCRWIMYPQDSQLVVPCRRCKTHFFTRFMREQRPRER